MTPRKSSKAGAIPRFKDEVEAGAFWDSHSPEEFPQEFREVQVTFSRPLIKRGLTIKLNEETIESLRRLGHERGLGPSTLARMWILEHLRDEEQRGRSQSKDS